MVDAVPVHTVEALVASMAIQPGGYRDWPNVGLWLTRACATVVADSDVDLGTADGAVGVVGVEGMIELLQGMPVAAWARAAYLLRSGGQDNAAAVLLAAAPGRATGPVYLGPRTGARVYDAPTGVYDALLATSTPHQFAGPSA